MSEQRWQRRDRKREKRLRDKTMRGNRDWQHAQPRPPAKRKRREAR